MSGWRDPNHPDSSDALTSHSCKYQLAVAGHLVASAEDLNSHHLIEFTVQRGMIWDFSIPPLGEKFSEKNSVPSQILSRGLWYYKSSVGKSNNLLEANIFELKKTNCR